MNWIGFDTTHNAAVACSFLNHDNNHHKYIDDHMARTPWFSVAPYILRTPVILLLVFVSALDLTGIVVVVVVVVVVAVVVLSDTRA